MIRPFFISRQHQHVFQIGKTPSEREMLEKRMECLSKEIQRLEIPSQDCSRRRSLLVPEDLSKVLSFRERSCICEVYNEIMRKVAFPVTNENIEERLASVADFLIQKEQRYKRKELGLPFCDLAGGAVKMGNNGLEEGQLHIVRKIKEVTEKRLSELQV